MANESKAVGPGFARREWGFLFFVAVLAVGIIGGVVIMVTRLQ